jgi:hypothetical protein
MLNEQLMDRLRVQGLLQRLRRQYGDQVARDIVLRAFELELPDPAKKSRKIAQVDPAD